MSTKKVLSSDSASAPLASPNVEVCKGINGLGSSAETSTHGLGSFSPSRTVPPPSSNVGPYASFAERCPYFPPWQYEVMNPDGSFSFVNLDRPKYAQNVPWSGPIDVDLVEECMRMIAALKRVARYQSFQHLMKENLLTSILAVANARIRSLEERIRDYEFHGGNQDLKFMQIRNRKVMKKLALPGVAPGDLPVEELVAQMMLDCILPLFSST